MPRPPIAWETRMAVFLAFREMQKVYPVAKRYGIGRSTVSGILKTFEQAGFSLTPRLSMSPDTLGLTQKAHLERVEAKLTTPPTIAPLSPSDKRSVGLKPEEILSEGAELLVEERVPSVLSNSLRWHLKGAEQVQVAIDVREALLDYDLRCLGLWQGIRRGIEVRCGLATRPFKGPDDRDEGAHLFHDLADTVYRYLLSGRLPSHVSLVEPLHWSPRQNEPEVLCLFATAVAVGSESDHKKVSKATTSFLEENFEDLRTQCTHLHGLYQDLSYLNDILTQALEQVDPEVVRQGLCPNCPYPEATARRRGTLTDS